MSAVRKVAIVAAFGLVTAACGLGDDDSSGNTNTTGTIKIGYVSPQTGALAPFGEADHYVIDTMTKYFRERDPRGGAGASGLHQLLEAGTATGLPPENRHDR